MDSGGEGACVPVERVGRLDGTPDVSVIHGEIDFGDPAIVGCRGQEGRVAVDDCVWNRRRDGDVWVGDVGRVVYDERAHDSLAEVLVCAAGGNVKFQRAHHIGVGSLRQGFFKGSVFDQLSGAPDERTSAGGGAVDVIALDNIRRFLPGETDAIAVDGGDQFAGWKHRMKP